MSTRGTRRAPLRKRERRPEPAARRRLCARQTGGDDLHGEDEKLAGELIGRAADGLTGAADYLRDHRTGDLLRDVQDFGRRNPAAFLGLSAAAGLLIARVGRTAVERQQPGSGFTGGRTSADFQREG